MHVPHAFQIDRAASLQFAAARGFGVICAVDSGKSIASHAPFHLEYARDGTPRAILHLARHNPLVALTGGGQPWLLAVQGDNAYVSPDWYASPHQVPTWLYQAVHLTGPVEAMPNDDLVTHLDALSEKFERLLLPKPPWSMSKMPEARRDGMMRAIVGLVMNVENVEGSFKLNQHKSDADHVAVTTALGLQTSPDAQAIARQMQAMRPHAFADDAADRVSVGHKTGLPEETM